VKSLTVLGKFFQTTLITSLLVPTLAFADPLNAGDSVTGPLRPVSGFIDFIVNYAHWNGSLLDRQDKQVYQRSLMIMLENVPMGQTVEWYSDRNADVSGRMRVVYGYQTSNGYCRTYQSQVSKGGNVKEWQEEACRSDDNPRWEFNYK
jgi:surface antigen